MNRDDKIAKVSDILNGREYNPYILIGLRLGIEIDSDSDIFLDIEEYIVDKYEEMEEENKSNRSCGFCGNKLYENAIYCSKECNLADNTERV